MRREMGRDWDAQRHEDRYSVDIPDVSFALPHGVAGWVELKAEGKSGEFEVSPGQIRWMLRRARLGVRCVLMARAAGGWWAGALVAPRDEWALLGARAAPDVAAIGVRDPSPRRVLLECLAHPIYSDPSPVL